MPQNNHSLWLNNETNWQPIDNNTDNSQPPALSSWLSDKSSLTVRLKQQCNSFNVKVLFEAPTLADHHEQTLILNNEHCWVREVYLHGDQTPWVFARSTMPFISGSDQLDNIQHLRSRPLGELLFSNPNLQIKGRFVAPIYGELQLSPMANSKQMKLWGRRTYYQLNELPIIVTEVFLPGFPAYDLTNE